MKSMEGNQKFWRNVVAVIPFAVGLMVAVNPAAHAASGDPNPGVLPIHSNAFGNSYGEWSARWWQWVLSIPAGTGHCTEGQTGKVWFGAGSFGVTGDDVCTIPAGKAVFLPLLNALFGAAVFDCEPTNPGVPCRESVLREGAAASMDSVEIEAEIDGVSLRNLTVYRMQSPLFSVTLPEGNIVGVPSGTYFPQVSDGYWLMVAPLSAGVHTVHVKGRVTGGVFEGFEAEATYIITVGR